MAGACDQINGTYTGSRIGVLGGNPALLAFDRLMLTAGAGTGTDGAKIASAFTPSWITFTNPAPSAGTPFAEFCVRA